MVSEQRSISNLKNKSLSAVVDNQIIATEGRGVGHIGGKGFLFRPFSQAYASGVLQRDVVYLWAPISPSRVQMLGEGGDAGSQPMSTAVLITSHGAQINFVDLPPYLTYGTVCLLFFTTTERLFSCCIFFVVDLQCRFFFPIFFISVCLLCREGFIFLPCNN